MNYVTNEELPSYKDPSFLDRFWHAMREVRNFIEKVDNFLEEQQRIDNPNEQEQIALLEQEAFSSHQEKQFKTE